MTLQEFTKAVNALAQEDCDQLNRAYEKGLALFGAEHVDYPESLLRLYYNKGLSPRETLVEMELEHEAEVYGESLVS